MRVGEGRIKGVSNGEGQVVLEELGQSCLECFSLAQHQGKGVCLVLIPSTQLDHAVVNDLCVQC